MENKKSFIQKITDYKIIIGIQILTSLILIGLAFKLNALPMKYTIGLIVVLLLLILGVFFLIKPSETGKTRKMIGKIISLLLSILMIVGCVYVSKSHSTINTITDANTETTRISVVVLKGSPYQKLSDLKDKKIGVNSIIDETKMKQAIDTLTQKEPTMQLVELEDFGSMSKQLYLGSVDALYVNEAYYTMFEAEHPLFEEETRVIYTYEIEEELEDISKDVSVTTSPFVVYITGIDTYGKVSTVSRSDVNMIVTINPTTKQILMTSIPRDYFVTLANKGKKDKLTHSGLAGVENTVKTVETFMGIDINYYARVNFTSLIQMVDALGGVDVNAIESFSTSQYHFNKGINHVDGKQALAFSRERYHVTGGDNGRVANQQRVLTAMLNKMISPAIITRYSSVLDSIDGSFETNMTSNDITSLIQMQINDMSKWTITTKQLKGTGKLMTGGAYMPSYRLYYMVPNEDSVLENKQAIQSVLNGETVQ